MIYKTIPIMERADGSLQIDSRNINLRQGDYNFKLQYSTYKDYSNYSPIVNVQVAFRRKDGQQTGWLPMTHIREKEYSINLKNSWFTKEAGILYMTFRVFQTNENNVQLIINTASASLPITPIAQFNPEEEDLLPSEFEVFQSQVNERLEDAVYNDNSTLKTFTGSTINPKTIATQVTTTKGTVQSDINKLYNDISLQKLGKGIFDNEQELLSTYPNGSNFPEGTWAVLLSTNTVWLYNSQTKQWYNSTRTITDIFELDDNVYKFAKQLYEESKNLFDISRLVLVKGGINISNSTIAFTSFANDSVNKLKDFSDLEAGKTYILTFNKSNAISNNYIYLVGSTTQWVNGTAHTITQEELDNIIILYGRNEYENIISEFMISEHGGEYNKYNQNRHITNNEAEFLKEEYEKSLNELYIADETKTIEGVEITQKHGVITLNGTALANIFIEFTINKLPPGNYAVNYFNNNYGGGSIQWNFFGVNGWIKALYRSESIVDFNEEITSVSIMIASGTNLNNQVIKPMMVKGSETPTEFHAYNGSIIRNKDVLNIKYLHTINLTTDNWRLWLNIYCDRSQPFTIVELSKWLYKNGYNATVFSGNSYQISGADRTYGRFACAISSPNNGSNVLYLSYGVASGAEGANITINEISDHVVEIIGGN